MNAHFGILVQHGISFPVRRRSSVQWAHLDTMVRRGDPFHALRPDTLHACGTPVIGAWHAEIADDLLRSQK